MSSASSGTRAPAKLTGECSVCHSARRINKNGTVHQHGPQGDRCPGSNKPPFLLLSQPATLASSPAFVAVGASSQPLSSTSSVLGTPAGVPVPFDHPQSVGRVVKHIPRSARTHCASLLTDAIGRVLANPRDHSAWATLLGFTQSILAAPARAGRRHNVASSIIKRKLDDVPTVNVGPWGALKPRRDDASSLAAAVRAKIEDGNVRAAARIICSDEKPAVEDDATLDALRQRHPAAPSDRAAPPDPSLLGAAQVTEEHITKAVRSFPAGSSGGPDGLRPQHLVDMVTCVVAGPALVTALTSFVNLLLEGQCPPEVAQVLFGGRMFALQKKSGGVRPIAIGYTLRRLAAKCANTYALSMLEDRLLPVQVGVGVRGGCEGAVHATRRFLTNMTDDRVLVKLDFRNAFNSIRRDVMLKTVAAELPGLFKFCLLSYGQPSTLKFGGNLIQSEEGVQQGDPLGPLLFCLTVQPLLESLGSELVVGFMDDVTLGGLRSSVASDVDTIITRGPEFGLSLNSSKCECICKDGGGLRGAWRGFQHVCPDSAMLLGAPLAVGSAMDTCLASRCADLSKAMERLYLVSAHDGLLLLKACLSASRLLYTLRSAFCVGHDLLATFDDLQRSALSRVCNVSLTDDQWLQASLPVRSGGLGFRRVSSLASSAFLASAAGTRLLQEQLLTRAAIVRDEDYDRCLAARPQHTVPDALVSNQQRAWDGLIVQDEFSQLLEKYSDPQHRARLLAAAADHSGDWLHALPITACGLHLDDEAVRVAVGLRLGCTLCESHTCRCGTLVGTRGEHAFSCKRSSARIQRHTYVNDVIWRALQRAAVPSTKEPTGLVRGDGKRPDGLTLLPWQSGRCATWDVTVVDTLGSAYLQQSAIKAASAAETAADRKKTKYAAIEQSHTFIPVALETMGPMCASAVEFVQDIGHKATEVTSDPRETQFLFQRISIAVQRFNAVCLADTFTCKTCEPSP